MVQEHCVSTIFTPFQKIPHAVSMYVKAFRDCMKKAKVKFDEAKRNNKAEPLFIRPSA